MARVPEGTTISLPTGFSAELTDISETGISREALDTTHLGTTGGWKTFIPAANADGGEVRIAGRITAGRPQMNADPEEFVITEVDGATNTFDGFFTGYEITRQQGGLEEFSATIKVTGEPVYVPATP